jgi:hypothetical protein
MMSCSVDDLKLGMILAKPVYNHQELLLLEAGVKITEKNIRMFKSWGVSAVWVKGESSDDADGDMGFEDQAREEMEMKLKEKFADVLDDPIMLEIMRAASNVLSKRIRVQDEET